MSQLPPNQPPIVKSKKKMAPYRPDENVLVLREMLKNRSDCFGGFANGTTAASIAAAKKKVWQWAISNNLAFTKGTYIDQKKVRRPRDENYLFGEKWQYLKRLTKVSSIISHQNQPIFRTASIVAEIRMCPTIALRNKITS